MDCLFCKIIEGSIPSKTIYENEYVKVIMDVHPTSVGHCLIIPKKHFTDFEEMDNETYGHLMDAAKLIKKYLYEALNPNGLVLIINYGKPQAIKHLHLHLIPTYENKQKEASVDDTYNKIMSVINK